MTATKQPTNTGLCTERPECQPYDYKTVLQSKGQPSSACCRSFMQVTHRWIDWWVPLFRSRLQKDCSLPLAANHTRSSIH